MCHLNQMCAEMIVPTWKIISKTEVQVPVGHAPQKVLTHNFNYIQEGKECISNV